MYVVEVTPLRRGMHRAALSYFSSTAVRRGALVTIPIRSKDTQGVVLSCTEVSLAKTALRSATFSLRKMPAQDTVSSFSDTLLATIDELAEYYAAQTGAVLFALMPNEIKNGVVTYVPSESSATTHNTEHTYEVLQSPTDARAQTYQNIVRESFASAQSVVLVVPTIEEGEHLFATLAHGIEDHTLLLHSGRGVRALRHAYTTLTHDEHPKFIIATPQYGFLTRDDVGTIILERSRALSYRSHVRPYIDFRQAYTTYARIADARLISADTLVRTEDAFLIEKSVAIPYEEMPSRLRLPGTLKVLQMRDKPDGTVPFTLFSPILLDTIARTRAARGRTFLFSARRGLAPVVACIDCGHILRCPQSGSPLSLHRTIENGVETRWLLSSVSGFKRRADDLCSMCGSWRLRERGIGIQHVYEELTRHFPQEDILLFDHETASTRKKAVAIRDEFYTRKKAILIGTALALPYLHTPVDLTGIVSMDSLRAIPSWRQEEEALGILFTLRERTNGYVFAQSRAEEDGLIGTAQKGTVEAFYKEELAVREEYAYPPYTVFIHLTWKKDASGVLLEEITTQFTPHDISLYDAPDAEDRIGYGLMRIPRDAWPDDVIVDKLRALPPSVRIIIDPDRLV